MLSRAILVLLAVMNLAVALWWATHAAPPAAPVVDGTPAGVPRLRLLSETAGADAPRAAPAVTRCFRFGPYADAETLDAARETAGALVAAVDVVTVPGPGADSWRVVAPPPRDGDAAALATRIVAAGFVDTMVVAEGAETGSVALGRFSTAEAAPRHAQAVRDAGFEAQVHPVGGNSDWLHLALPPGAPLQDVRASLSALQAQPADCAPGA